jgi:hypothetical protein
VAAARENAGRSSDVSVAFLLALLMVQAEPGQAAQPEPSQAEAPALDAGPEDLSTDAGEEVDVIDALLRAARATPAPVVAPEVVPPPARASSDAARAVRPFEMPPVIPTEPTPYAFPLPETPVTIEAYRGQYEPPKDVVQARYDRGVMDNLARAAARAGPLEGVWRVADPDGRALYQLALIDADGGDVEVEGAWRDLRATATPGGSGPISFARVEGGVLELRFYEAGRSEPTLMTLRRIRGDRWTGDLAAAGQAPRPVTMTPSGL